jgi:hypothetical protein
VPVLEPIHLDAIATQAAVLAAIRNHVSNIFTKLQVACRRARPGSARLAGAEPVERDVEDVADVAGLRRGDLGDADDHVHDLLEGGIGAHVA